MLMSPARLEFKEVIRERFGGVSMMEQLMFAIWRSEMMQENQVLDLFEALDRERVDWLVGIWQGGIYWHVHGEAYLFSLIPAHVGVPRGLLIGELYETWAYCPYCVQHEDDEWIDGWIGYEAKLVW